MKYDSILNRAQRLLFALTAILLTTTSARTQTAPIDAFQNGHFTRPNWKFELGFNLGGTSPNVCYFTDPNDPTIPYDPTQSPAADIKDKFNVYKTTGDNSSDAEYTSYIASSALVAEMPDYFIRLGNHTGTYNIFKNGHRGAATENEHTTLDKWPGPGGNSCYNDAGNYGAFAEKATFTVAVTNTNKYLQYFYSVFSGPGHSAYSAPYFSIDFYDGATEILCAKNTLVFIDDFQDTQEDLGYVVDPAAVISETDGTTITGEVAFKPWTSRLIDLSAYVGKTITVFIQSAGCSLDGHGCVTYFSAQMVPQPQMDICRGDKNVFNFNMGALDPAYSDKDLTWNFGDGSPTVTQKGSTIAHTYSTTPHTYTVTVSFPYSVIYPDPNYYDPAEPLDPDYYYLDSIGCTFNFYYTVNTPATSPCSTALPSCANCITPSILSKGKYVLSAWVKEDNADRASTSYSSPKIIISLGGKDTTLTPSGEIIDGWQRIESVFRLNTDDGITIKLQSDTKDAYFDDIRLFPFDGSMISYVYDPLTLRLVAELDERNYAKFYEYDEEGKLVRVKKETEKGVMTIQENRENSSGK